MKLLNGFEKTLYMNVEDLKAHGLRYSQTFKRGFGLWADDFSKMAEKTVLKQLLNRYAPLSIEMETALRADQAVITENGEKYIDNPKRDNSEEYEDFEEVDDLREETDSKEEQK